jgi:hypothetical protein
MAGALWTALAASWGFIARHIHQISTNTGKIAEQERRLVVLEQWKRDMGGNGK